MTKRDPVDLSRELADEAIAVGDHVAAESALREFWRRAPGHARAPVVNNRFERLREELPLRRARIAILRSFTVEPIVPLLRAEGFVSRLDLEIWVGGFNTYAQELLDQDSDLYRFRPDVVMLVVQTRDVLPELWDGFSELDDEGVERAVSRADDFFRQLVGAFTAMNAQLVLHTLEVPATPAAGVVLEAQSERSQVEAIRRLNHALAELSRKTPDVVLLDYDALVARRGREQWFDARTWLTARMPIAPREHVYLAEEWVRLLHPLLGRICKAVAVDLDNTLWGGVIGEEGFDGIALDDNHAGVAYRDVQRALLDLHRRGIMLAVCSKNNPAEALDALERHPGMLLRPDHFSAMRINWQDKAANLLEIAGELNIGVDSVAFLDDNPVEREFVRRQLADVTVIDLPNEPLEFADAIRRAPVFERVRTTDEDRQRGRYYAEERKRRELETSTGSLEDFLRSLELQVEIAAVTPATLPRAAQLTQKTNQFNLTTRRYTEQELADLAASPRARVFTLRSADRFGDNGIVGLAILRFEGDEAEIDNLLMSCRVIGRTIETAFLATVVEEARAAGARCVLGRFMPTAKNAPAQSFYADHGFEAASRSTNGDAVWRLDLEEHTVACPDWIERTVVQPAEVLGR